MLIAGLAVAVCTSIEPGPDSPAPMVDSARIMATLQALPTARAATGNEASRRGLEETEKLLTDLFRQMGYEPRLQELGWRATPQRRPESGEPDPYFPTWHNIIVEIPGRDLPSEVLIFGAHFDAVPRSPGADDNGSGVAAVMELARVLKDQPMRRTVRLILFNLEEIGLQGSTEYVTSILPAIQTGQERVIGMASLDMLGYYSDEPGSQRSPIPARKGLFEPPSVADFIGMAGVLMHRGFSQKLNTEMLAASPGLKTVVVDFLPIAPPDLLRSDHAPFLLAGMPAVILSDTANFRNPNYHRPTDSIDTIDLDRLTAVVRGLAGAAYVIAEPATGSTDEQSTQLEEAQD